MVGLIIFLKHEERLCTGSILVPFPGLYQWFSSIMAALFHSLQMTHHQSITEALTRRLSTNSQFIRSLRANSPGAVLLGRACLQAIHTAKIYPGCRRVQVTWLNVVSIRRRQIGDGILINDAIKTNLLLLLELGIYRNWAIKCKSSYNFGSNSGISL